MSASSWRGMAIVPILRKEEDIDEHLDTIKANILSLVEDNKRMSEELSNFKAEVYAANEMQKMKAKYEEMRSDYFRGFPISADEMEAIHKWQKEHDTEKHNNPEQYYGCSGGGYTFEFVPTGIGTAGSCICSTCHLRAIQEACKSGQYDRKVYRAYMEGSGGEFEFQHLG